MKNNSQNTSAEKSPTRADNRMRIAFDCTKNSAKLFDVSKQEHVFSLAAHNFTTKEPPHSHSNIYGYIRHVFPSADVSCTAGENSIGVDIVIKKNTENTFPFVLSSQTLDAKRMESDHRILLCDTDLQAPVFAIVDPIAMDGKNRIAPPVFCNVAWTGAHQIQFTYCLDREWLEAGDRAFPVTLHVQIAFAEVFPATVAQFEDFSPDDLFFHVGLRHCYAPEPDTKDSAESSLPLKMNLGRGWGLNLLQSIKPVLQNFKVTAFRYRDGENRQTLLFRSDEEIDETDRAPGSDTEDNYDMCECCCDMEYHSSCDYEYGEHYHDADDVPQKVYYYKSKDGSLTYNPETRVLQKGTDRLVFDMGGRLIRIVDSDNHSVSIVYRDGRILQLFGGLRHSFHFDYSEDDYLIAIIGPYNQWVQYDYVEGCLREACFSSGRKFAFSAPPASGNELIMRIQKE